MRRSVVPAAIAAAVVLAIGLGCAGATRAREATPLPSLNAGGGDPPDPASLRTVELDRVEWKRIGEERLARACEPKPDEGLLRDLDAAIAEWAREAKKKKSKSGVDPTRRVSALAVSCTPKPSIAVNGVTQPVDALWASVRTHPRGKLAVVQGMTNDGGVVLVRLDAAGAEADAVVVADAHRYFPHDPRDVVVRLVHDGPDPEDARLETFIVETKKPTAGLYLLAPLAGESGPHFAGLGRFVVR